jgi:hypothetical protein
MQSINDLSCNDQLATSAGCRALERKMIDDLMAKVNFTPDKATPLDAMKSNAQKAIELMNARTFDKNLIIDDCTKKLPLDAAVSRAFELALAGFNTSPARLKLPTPAYLLTEVVEAFTCLNPFYLARLLNALSIKTANYLRGISERVVDSMTFKNNFKNLNNLLFNFGVKHHAVKNKEKPLTTL